MLRDRRAILIGLLGVLLPSPAYAQKSSTPPHIGWLSAGTEPDPFLEAFREGLRSLGYVDDSAAAPPAGGSNPGITRRIAWP